MAGRFRYLNVGLGVILAFVGVKMLIAEWYHFPTWASLAVITVVLTVAIVASLRAVARDPEPDPAAEDTAGPQLHE
jgi:tellurite resistance protein TerC